MPGCGSVSRIWVVTREYSAVCCIEECSAYRSESAQVAGLCLRVLPITVRYFGAEFTKNLNGKEIEFIAASPGLHPKQK